MGSFWGWGRDQKQSAVMLQERKLMVTCTWVLRQLVSQSLSYIHLLFYSQLLVEVVEQKLGGAILNCIDIEIQFFVHG